MEFTFCRLLMQVMRGVMAVSLVAPPRASQTTPNKDPLLGRSGRNLTPKRLAILCRSYRSGTAWLSPLVSPKT